MLSAIILAAGRGSRLKVKVSKPLIRIDNRPLINYSLSTLSNHPGIDEIIIVYSIKNKKQVVEAVKNIFSKKIKSYIVGGERRQDSVYNGLKEVSQKSDWVLIHDSARPFIDNKSISRVIQGAKKTGAAILGVPVKVTVKSIRQGGFVKKTIDRSNLWEIQTPQVFKKRLIIKAYEKYAAKDVTDDSSLVEKLGVKVKIVQGKGENIKITTQVDLYLAQLIAQRLKNNAI